MTRLGYFGKIVFFAILFDFLILGSCEEPTKRSLDRKQPGSSPGDDDNNDVNIPQEVTGSYLTGSIINSSTKQPVEGMDIFLRSHFEQTKTAADGTFRIEFKASSDEDMMLIAVKADSTNNLGTQIRNIDFQSTNDLGIIIAKPLGFIQGNIKLFDADDHTGISVYIPGTSFSAFTDQTGNFTLQDVPEGTWDLMAEHDGYQSANISEIKVVSGQESNIGEVILFVGTGVHGQLVLADNKETFYNEVVPAKIYVSPNALVWRVSESNDFTNIEYEPFPGADEGKNYHSFTHKFVVEGMSDSLGSPKSEISAAESTKSLYVQIADQDGLETTFSDSISIVPAEPGSELSLLAPLPLAIFIGETSTLENGKISLTIGFSSQDAYSIVKIFRAVGDLPPACNLGTLIASFTVFSDTTFTDSGTLGAKYSYRACIVGKNGRLTDTDTISGVRTSNIAGVWSAMPDATNARTEHTTVLIGNKVVSWGGLGVGGGRSNTGDVYNVDANSWTTTTTTNAPSARIYHTAVATSNKMIIWGGEPSSGWTNTGAVYDPSANSWTATTTTNAPTAREKHSAIWTGEKMIIWGGNDNTGGVYDPGANSWTATSTTNAPTGRYGHAAVWINNKMVIWGGYCGTCSLLFTSSGGIYDPSSNTWQSMSSSGAPSGRLYFNAVAAENKLIIWGGQKSGGDMLNTGAIYDPSLDKWTEISLDNAPSARRFASAVWTGDSLVIWSGEESYTPNILTNSGYLYDLEQDSWATLSSTGVPDSRRFATGVWTGSKVIFFGGNGSSGYLSSGGILEL